VNRARGKPQTRSGAPGPRTVQVPPVAPVAGAAPIQPEFGIPYAFGLIIATSWCLAGQGVGPNTLKTTDEIVYCKNKITLDFIEIIDRRMGGAALATGKGRKEYHLKSEDWRKRYAPMT